MSPLLVMSTSGSDAEQKNALTVLKLLEKGSILHLDELDEKMQLNIVLSQASLGPRRTFTE